LSGEINTRYGRTLALTDPRIDKLADVLVNYSLEIKPDQLVVLQSTPLAQPLIEAVYRKVIDIGAHPVVNTQMPGLQEIMFTRGSEAQLTRLTSRDRFVIDEADAVLNVISETNTKALSGADPNKQRTFQAARREIMRKYLGRSAEGTLNWCVTLFPTNAYAQDAEMSLNDYTEFVYSACHLDLDDPVAHWKGVSAEHQRLIDWLNGKSEIHLTGPDTDLKLLVTDRTWINADGKRNFPDGELFTGPIEDSVEGTVRFSYPSSVQGREVEDIRLWFEAGKVVKATAGKNQDYLEQMLDADDGARRLGEFAFGTNMGIQKFTKNILFDEKIGGTIHMAIGAGYPDSGSINQSAIHWDMICDLRQGGQATVDGELFMKDGKIVV
jgi:aminopeptidase